jgi:hypothetical protein
MYFDSQASKTDSIPKLQDVTRFFELVDTLENNTALL